MLLLNEKITVENQCVTKMYIRFALDSSCEFTFIIALYIKLDIANKLIQISFLKTQEHLHVSLGNDPRPAQIQQTLRSVGASRVRISRPSSAISQRSGGSDPAHKVALSPAVAPPTASESDSGREDQPLGVPPQVSSCSHGNTSFFEPIFVFVVFENDLC